MRYITSMPLVYNEVFIALYERLKELKENGKEIYFGCDEGVAGGKKRLKEFNALAPGAGYGDIFTDVIDYNEGRTESAKAIVQFAQENKIDVNEFIVVTNSDLEHQSLIKENIKCVNIWFYDRDNLLCDWDKILPG